jgi:ketosteroid isomerase-like protein
MMMVALGVGGCGAAAKTSTTTITPTDSATSALALLEQWRQAYEVRSVEALSKIYSPGKSLIVVAQGQRWNGWDNVSTVLKGKLDSAREVHITLNEVASQAIGSTTLITATMVREISNGSTTVKETGVVTWGLELANNKWQIVSEHFSYRGQ